MLLEIRSEKTTSNDVQNKLFLRLSNGYSQKLVPKADESIVRNRLTVNSFSEYCTKQ